MFYKVLNLLGLRLGKYWTEVSCKWINKLRTCSLWFRVTRSDLVTRRASRSIVDTLPNHFDDPVLRRCRSVCERFTHLIVVLSLLYSCWSRRTGKVDGRPFDCFYFSTSLRSRLSFRGQTTTIFLTSGTSFSLYFVEKINFFLVLLFVFTLIGWLVCF